MKPLFATNLGLPGSDHRWDDLSPEGWEETAALVRRHREALDEHMDHSDPDQRHAARVLAGFLDLQLDRFEHGDHLRDVSHIYCGFTVVRDIFDIMPRDSATAWSNIAARLATLERPLRGWRESLARGLAQGLVASRRQVESVIGQAEHLAGDDSMVIGLLKEAEAAGFRTPELHAAVDEARKAAAETAEWLRNEYLPHADPADGVGEERYLRSAEQFLGMVIDPEEVYEWGWEELTRLWEEMREAAAEVDPDKSVEEVLELLDTDPARAVPREEFTAFVQERLDQAVSELDGSHFDVPPPVRAVTVNLAPPGGALGAWYINPSSDWERPGSVWY